MERQLRARAQGTNKNHRASVHLFVAFCCYMGIHQHHASHEDYCAYIEYLAQHINAPSTIRNKISHVRVHLTLAEAPTHQINHSRVYPALDALERDVEYIPRVKQPLDPKVFYSVIVQLPRTYIGLATRAALLTIYYGAFRQTELLPKTVGAWCPHTQPTRGDITFHHSSCEILIKRGKNMQKAGQSRTVCMDTADNPHICPVSALREMILHCPTHFPHDPLFMFKDNRRPIPVTKVTAMLYQMMRQIGEAGLISTTTLHSIRKSSATDAYAAGCSETSIKNFGGWSSAAYRAYIRTSNRTVNQVLMKSIDCQPYH